MPKGVLSTQRQFLSNILNVRLQPLFSRTYSDMSKVTAGGLRASLRRGEDYPDFDKNEEPQKGILVPVPLFHVTGTTSFSVRPEFPHPLLAA